MVEAKETEYSSLPIQEKIMALSEGTHPLELLTADIKALQERLVEGGLKLVNIETVRNSLLETQFRNFETGRGKAMFQILGRSRATALKEWSTQAAHNFGWQGVKIEGFDGTQGRGILQAAADLVSLAVLPTENHGKILLKLNQRVKRGFERRGRMDALAAFAAIPDPEEPSKMASVPPGVMSELWKFLTKV